MTGRPTIYTEAIAAEICDRLAQGESLRTICSDEHIPARVTIHDWILKDRSSFANRYTQARDIGLDYVADEVMDIADNGTNDWMERNAQDNPGWTINGEALGRSRLRFDARRWYLSKLAPKRYGDSSKVELSGQVTINDMTEDEMRAELAMLAGVLPAISKQEEPEDDNSDLV